MDIKSVQLALNERGYGVGVADGIWGRKSIAALKTFQKSAGLTIDGLLGPKTLAALFPKETAVRTPAGNAPVTALEPVWYSELFRLKGLREAPGAQNNPTIMGWAAKLGLWYPGDSTAWCGLGQAHVIGATLPEEVLPTNPLGAREWLTFGVALKQPAVGAIMVFWRGSKAGWLGHVAQYVSESATAYNVLGCNQGDSISITSIKKDRLLGIRWPKTFPLPVSGMVAGVSGKTSTNEA